MLNKILKTVRKCILCIVVSKGNSAKQLTIIKNRHNRICNSNERLLWIMKRPTGAVEGFSLFFGDGGLSFFFFTVVFIISQAMWLVNFEEKEGLLCMENNG